MIPKWLLPQMYREGAFIAGGYAACPALASDMDVWVPVGLHGIETDLRRLVRWLGTNGAMEHHAGLEDAGNAVGAEDATSMIPRDVNYDINVVVFKVGVVRPLGVGAKPIHLMVCAGSVMDVLTNFDISTHQIALTSEGGVVCGPNWTPITEPPVAFRTNTHTPARLAKITARYKAVA